MKPPILAHVALALLNAALWTGLATLLPFGAPCVLVVAVGTFCGTLLLLGACWVGRGGDEDAAG